MESPKGGRSIMDIPSASLKQFYCQKKSIANKKADDLPSPL